MKWWCPAVLFCAIGACGGQPFADDGSDLGGGTADAGAAPDLAPAPTWTYVYQNYFGPNTPGHCGDPGCHGTPLARKWLCGTTSQTCFAGMVQIGLISLGDPTHSPLADPAQSVLSWVDPDGSMPEGDTGPDPTARADILEWVAAGAKNN